MLKMLKTKAEFALWEIIVLLGCSWWSGYQIAQ